MVALRLVDIGDDVSVILPAELSAGLGVTAGDTLYTIETVDGRRLFPADPNFEEQMTEASRIMQERPDLLRH